MMADKLMRRLLLIHCIAQWYCLILQLNLLERTQHNENLSSCLSRRFCLFHYPVICSVDVEAAERGGRREEEEEEKEEEGAKAVVLNLVNCLMEAISPVGGDIACQQNHV